MSIEGADTDARRSRDRFETRLRPASAEYGFCRLQHPFAVASRVNPRLSWRFFVHWSDYGRQFSPRKKRSAPPFIP
jgi:hypothetical protein